MPSIISPPIRFSSGKVTSDTPEALGDFLPTALVATQGGAYTQDSPILRRALGRTEFSAVAPSTGFASIFAADFNAIADQLVMFQGTGMFSAPIGSTGIFAFVPEQREFDADPDVAFPVTAQTDPITGVKFGDTFLLADGVSRPTFYENNLRARVASLVTPKGAITLTDPGVGTFIRPNSSTLVNGVVENAADMFDTDTDTYGTIRVSSTTGGFESTILLEFAAGAGATRDLNVTLEGSSARKDPDPFLEPPLSYSYAYRIEISTDNGTTFTTLRTGLATTTRVTLTDPISGTPVLEDIQVRISLYDSNETDSGAGALNVFDVTLHTGGTIAQFSTTFGVRYAWQKVRKYERSIPGLDNPRTLEIVSSLSPLSPSDSADVFTVANFNGVQATISETLEPEVTHWRLFRSPDGPTNDETLSIDTYILVGEAPASTLTIIDLLDEAGFPFDHDDPFTILPIILVGDIIYDSNSPPPSKCSVVGSYQQSALYATNDAPGQFWWSRPRQPDYVPAIYSDFIVGRITAFADIGVLLVFTPQRVYAYATLPIASDADFTPGRNAQPISGVRGCVSRRGVAVFQSSEGETIAAFVAGDGIYATNGIRSWRLSLMLDWPEEITKAQLENAILDYDPDDDALRLIYLDDQGEARALLFSYNHPGTATEVAVSGPQRWPASSTTTITQSDGIFRIYSEDEGLVWLEKNGTRDNADLEDVAGAITYSQETVTVYPFGPQREGMVELLLIRTPATVGASMDVTITVRTDENPEKTLDKIPHDLDLLGWKKFNVSRSLEAIRFTVTTTSENFPGLDAWALQTVEPTVIGASSSAKG